MNTCGGQLGKAETFVCSFISFTLCYREGEFLFMHDCSTVLETRQKKQTSEITMPPVRHPAWFPEMSLTLVRRASADLPKGNFIFRTDPKWTKPEIREYLEKVYNIKVERVATINYLGKLTYVYITSKLGMY